MLASSRDRFLPKSRRRKCSICRPKILASCILVLAFWVAHYYRYSFLPTNSTITNYWSLLDDIIILSSSEAPNLSDEAHSKASVAVAVHNNNAEELPVLVIFTGLVRSTEDIRPTTWELLKILSCQFNVSIHVTAAQDPRNLGDEMKKMDCAPFHFDFEIPGALRSIPKGARIKRMMILRDIARERVKQLFFPNHNTGNPDYYHKSVIIMADLDMFLLPNATEIMKRVQLIQSSVSLQQGNTTKEERSTASAAVPSSPSLICAAGRDARIFTKKGEGRKRRTRTIEVFTDRFYDRYAAIYLPNTFAYPVGNRMGKKLYPDENKTLAEASNSDATRYLAELADSRGLAPIRSCFSGLSLYRASMWLTPTCQYLLDPSREPKDGNNNSSRPYIMRYAALIKKEHLPCEHVVFHECLRRTYFGTANENTTTQALLRDMVVDTNLLSYRVFGK